MYTEMNIHQKYTCLNIRLSVFLSDVMQFSKIKNPNILQECLSVEGPPTHLPRLGIKTLTICHGLGLQHDLDLYGRAITVHTFNQHYVCTLVYMTLMALEASLREDHIFNVSNHYAIFVHLAYQFANITHLLHHILFTFELFLFSSILMIFPC